MKDRPNWLPVDSNIMRILFCFVFIVIVIPIFSREKADSAKTKLIFNGCLSINSNGLAPIPSFSLDKPALIAAFTLQKKRFSYDPQIAYGLDMRPWIIDNWLHYRLIYKPGFELRTGFDFSMFFSEYDAGDTKILQGQQYLTFEIAGIFKFSPKSSLSLMYWSDNGQDPGSIKGNFYNMVYDRADIEIGESILFSGSLQFFYIGYEGNNDGLFVSPKIALSVKKIPLSLFFQATQALTSNIEPYPGFRWNAGLGYMF
jgi:hypothetical protein